MDRRRPALVLLVLFIGCIGVAVVVSGTRPALQQGIAPTIAAYVGYLSAFVAAVLLLAPGAGEPRGGRALGITVLGALVVLVLLDALTEHGPDVGAGLVQLVGEVVIVGATVRLALRVAAARRAR